jgi:hypothetical protein
MNIDVWDYILDDVGRVHRPAAVRVGLHAQDRKQPEPFDD